MRLVSRAHLLFRTTPGLSSISARYSEFRKTGALSLRLSWTNLGGGARYEE